MTRSAKDTRFGTVTDRALRHSVERLVRYAHSRFDRSRWTLDKIRKHEEWQGVRRSQTVKPHTRSSRFTTTYQRTTFGQNEECPMVNVRRHVDGGEALVTLRRFQTLRSTEVSITNAEPGVPDTDKRAILLQCHALDSRWAVGLGSKARARQPCQSANNNDERCKHFG